MKRDETKVFLLMRYVQRRDGTTGYAVEWITRPMGSVVYRSKTCQTKAKAIALAHKWLERENRPLGPLHETVYGGAPRKFIDTTRNEP